MRLATAWLARSLSSQRVPTTRGLLARLDRGLRRRPKVSVAVLTYNHAEFVAQALGSVLDQKASFEWEIVVGDDCSTDGTREILKSYARKHPERIRLLLHPQGLGPHELNLAGNNNFLATYRACRGEYVALLDGDDYWTNDSKLEKQVRFLDTHPNCSLCCHAVAVEYSGERGRNWDPVIGESAKEICSIEDILRLETKPEMPEPSMMIRRRSLRKFPDWFNGMFNSDYALQVLLAERGDVGFLSDCMAVHRKHAGGASRIYDTDPDFCNAMLLKLHLALNEHLEYQYASILGPYIEHERLLADAATSFSDPGELGPSTAVSLALEGFVPASGRLWREADGRLAIVTAPTQWAYAARLPLATDRGEKDGTCAYACVRGHAERSIVGIGVLNRAGDRFLDRQTLDPTQGELELRLRIPRLQEAGDLVVQTWAGPESGTVHLESIALVVFALSSAAAASR
jgi:glycosyltransferase involved in cell wall biosynthesis